jgi:hypothetical protein
MLHDHHQCWLQIWRHIELISSTQELSLFR